MLGRFAGFRVLPQSPGSRSKTLDVIAFMPAAGHAQLGASYRVLDDAGLEHNGAGTVYFIEDISVFGKVTRHGPIEITGSRVGRNGRSR